jgi:hypothetical protein
VREKTLILFTNAKVCTHRKEFTQLWLCSKPKFPTLCGRMVESVNGQIIGWARGDSLCIKEWPGKTFFTLPNWIEHVTFFVLPLSIYYHHLSLGIAMGLTIIATEFVIKGFHYFEEACRIVSTWVSGGWLRKAAVAVGTGSVLSAQRWQEHFHYSNADPCTRFAVALIGLMVRSSKFALTSN